MRINCSLLYVLKNAADNTHVRAQSALPIFRLEFGSLMNWCKTQPRAFSQIQPGSKAPSALTAGRLKGSHACWSTFPFFSSFLSFWVLIILPSEEEEGSLQSQETKVPWFSSWDNEMGSPGLSFWAVRCKEWTESWKTDILLAFLGSVRLLLSCLHGASWLQQTLFPGPTPTKYCFNLSPHPTPDTPSFLHFGKLMMGSGYTGPVSDAQWVLCSTLHGPQTLPLTPHQPPTQRHCVTWRLFGVLISAREWEWQMMPTDVIPVDGIWDCEWWAGFQ